MNRIHDYLSAQAKCHWGYHARPVVAIDVLAAKIRAEHLEQLASQVRDMSDADALAHLLATRAAYIKPDCSTTWTIFVSNSESKWFDGIVDRVSREATGWIEVQRTGYDGAKGKLLNLPRYRRMLDINHCVESLARELDESDEAWLRRRAEWLAHYHPDVKVIHSQKRWVDKGREGEEIVLGTVQSFSQQEHLVEADLCSIRGFKMQDGVEFEMVEAFLTPAENGAIGVIRQTAGAVVPLGALDLRDYRLELVA